MKENLFKELIESVKQGGAILRSEMQPSRSRNWEQGRRKPEGSARVLLRVAATHPEAILDTVHNS